MANVTLDRRQSSPPAASAPAQEKPAKTNPYYASLAGKFKVAKYITLVLFIAFLLSSFTLKRSEITLENLQYLMKFISFTNTETSITATKINYSASDDTHLALFNGDLCYLSPIGYSLYDARGNTIDSEPIKYSSPEIEVSDGFVLCYDLGGNSFTILNTFSRLYSETLDYPITAACIADNGSFAVGTNSREYRTAVCLYDNNFKLISRVYKDKYLTGLAMKKDASEVAVMTTGAKSGEYYSEISLIVPGAEQESHSTSIPALGYQIRYHENGISVLSDEGIWFFDKSLNLKKQISYPASLTMVNAGSRYLACAYQSGIIENDATVCVYGEDGTQFFGAKLDGKLTAISISPDGNDVFVLSGSTVYRLDMAERKLGKATVESGSSGIIAQSHDSFLLVMPNYALTCADTSFEEVTFAQISK